MTGVSHQAIVGSGVRLASLSETISGLALTSGLQLCLDAGDATSYTSGQTWSDVSGNSNHYYRGSGSGSDSADPTFNGTAGTRSSSEYFSSDGADAFWQTSAQTFMQAWHKNNATFAVAGWIYMAAGATRDYYVIRNVRDDTDIGVFIGITPLSASPVTGKGYILVDNGSAGQYLIPGSASTISEDSWMFFAASFAEGTGTSFFMYNDTVDSVSDTVTSPSASNAPNGVSIWGVPNSAGTGLDTDATARSPSGSRLNCLAAWNGFLTQSQLTTLYNATKGKFGL